MRAKSSKPADLLPRWRVSAIRKRAETIATIRAKDEADALARLVEEYGIADPAQQKRLFARRLD